MENTSDCSRRRMLLIILVIVLISKFACAGGRGPNHQQQQQPRRSSSFRTPKPYDFIVVGGGTGGCAIARRLAESGLHSVLLIESGDVPPNDLEIPAFAPRYVPDRNVTSVFPSFPQKLSAKRKAGIITSISGRMLGGTSSLNYMWFNRGSPNDYNNWANLTRDSSWSYSKMLPYFKKSETYEGDYPSDQHGYQGPITITRPRYAPGLDLWLEAGRQLGYVSDVDPNGPQRISFAPVDFSKRFGRRVSSYTGYLKPILPYRPNLHVILNSNVTEIIFSGKRAIGVRHNSPWNPTTIEETYASKEIILSAGTYISPLILLRSGIGPRRDLEACGIPLIQDLPVGLSFHDHVALPLHLFVNDSRAVIDESAELNAENLEYFNRVGDGPYSNTRGGTGQAFIASSVAKSEGQGDWADLHLLMAHSDEPYLSAYISPDGNETIDDPEIPMSAAVFLVRPKSRGTLRLDPKDPLGLPILDVGYFSDPRDIQMALDGINEAVRIFEETPAYQRIGARVVTIEYEECRGLEFRSDEFWKCYITHATQAGLHAGGTCRMGWGEGDPLAVVDSRLKVIGVEGVRVVDASVMPVQTNANTQGAVYGIAERAGELVLGEWGEGEKRSGKSGKSGKSGGIRKTLRRVNRYLLDE